jgi:hypothetical protein
MDVDDGAILEANVIHQKIYAELQGCRDCHDND